jgi:propanol-preferring alcohol dehydrogenase
MMRAALLDEYRTDLEIRDVPVPEPGPGEVLVRVGGAGLCHSDLHLVDGEIPVLPAFPWVLGHEVAGWVEASDRGVPGVEHGDPVAIFGGWGCGRCRVCVNGDEQLCNTTSWLGIGHPGGFAQYVVAPARHLVPLGSLDPVSSAPLTDAALTPYRAVRKALPRLVPGSTAVVIGCGGLGLMAVQLLSVLSPTRILVIEPSDRRGAMAREHGATDVFHPDDEALEGLRAQADVVLDFVASDTTLARAGELARVGGLVVILGIAGGSLPVGFFSPTTEVEVTTSYWGNRAELEQVIALAEAGGISVPVHEMDLSAVNSAVKQLRAGQVDGRIVLVP